MIKLIKEYIYWKRNRGNAKMVQLTQIPCSPELYAIAPYSFRVTRENWRKMNIVI